MMYRALCKMIFWGRCASRIRVCCGGKCCAMRYVVLSEASGDLSRCMLTHCSLHYCDAYVWLHLTPFVRFLHMQ